MSNYDYVDVLAPKESGFDLSYSNKFTMDLGDLVPCYMQEVIPGDEFKAKAQFMVRMAPLANPIFTKLNAKIEYFFVPNRLLWDGGKDNDWETFITGGRDGTLEPVPPFLNLDDIYSAFQYGVDSADGEGAQTLCDYMGIPANPDEETGDFRGIKINMLPFLAYNKIFDDWYRDPNVSNSLFDTYEDVWMNGGDLYGGDETNIADVSELLRLKKRAWRKDYFTSALPWAQRGEEVHIPSGTLTGNLYGAGTEGAVVQMTPLSGESVLGATIRDLRNANALQLWLEKNALGGARYIEQILAHFGVRPSDGRLQRAQYLGSASSPVVISEVQSNASTEDEPLGKLGGKGVSYGNDFIFKDKFKEHGWIIGIMSILPEASYCQGLNRCLTHRNDKLDYAFPEFAELGLQEINNSEIYVSGSSEDDNVFGYNDRYAEYKSNYNQVHGLFRNPYETLAQYNMTRFYSTTPELSSSFLEIKETDITSPFVDTTENAGNYWVDLYNDVKAVRPLPKNSIPLM